MKSYIERIKCPECNTVQEAVVKCTSPFNTYIHECKNCHYIITESEWNEVQSSIPSYITNSNK